MQIIFLSLLTIFSSAAFAGWQSGGGELIQDAQNPWFVQNTREIKYCTLYDFNYYHQTHQKTQEILEDAISFWKEEFQHGQSIFEPRIEVATQRFIHTSCSNGPNDVDIVFQFGFLDTEQLEFIEDPTKYAALAIRTEYDKVNLRGKGFVYIAADSGRHKFQGENTVDLPWSYGDGGLLYWTLVHELGHVFGLSHSLSRGESRNVMASNFIETIMSRNSAGLYSRDLVVNPIFKARAIAGDIPSFVCQSESYLNALKRFFGIEPSWQCYGFKLISNGLEVYAGPSGSSIGHIGTATFTNRSFTLVRDALHFWLPPEQTIFQPSHKVYTPAYYITDAVAIYQNRDGTITRQMSIAIDPMKDDPMGDDLKLGGILDGRLYVNFREGI